MSAPFILVSTFRVKKGSLEDLRDFCRGVTDLVQAQEPRVIALHIFLSEDGTELSTFHLHPDLASMEFHMQVQQANWEETFSRSATMLEGVRVDFYGATPPESALVSFRQAGSEVAVKPVHLAGLTRAATS